MLMAEGHGQLAKPSVAEGRKARSGAAGLVCGAASGGLTNDQRTVAAYLTDCNGQSGGEAKALE